MHWCARCCCCPAAIQKICNPRLWETKAVGAVDQGHVQAVAEAAFPGHHPASILLARSPQGPARPLPAQTAGHPLEACLWHFSTGPSRALARMRKEGVRSCPPRLFSPSNPLTLSPGFPRHCWGCLSCSTVWGAQAVAGLRGLPTPPGSLAPS